MNRIASAGPRFFTSTRNPFILISFNVFASIHRHLHQPLNGVLYSGSYLVFVLLNRFYEGIIRCQEDRTCTLCACKMKGIKRVQTVPVILPCYGFNFIINLHTALCKLEHALHIFPSFFVRYLKNLLFYCFTSHQFPIRHTSFENLSNRLGLHPDSMNSLVIKRPAQAAYVQIDSLWCHPVFLFSRGTNK